MSQFCGQTQPHEAHPWAPNTPGVIQLYRYCSGVFYAETTTAGTTQAYTEPAGPTTIDELLTAFEQSENWRQWPDVQRIVAECRARGAAVSRVRELHQPIREGDQSVGRVGECAGCAGSEDFCCGDHLWPCETVRALDAEQ